MNEKNDIFCVIKNKCVQNFKMNETACDVFKVRTMFNIDSRVSINDIVLLTLSSAKAGMKFVVT